MNRFFKSFCCLLFIFLGVKSYGQYRTSYNYLGIQGGVNSFNILTDNFNTTSQTGFTGGFSVRGGVLNNFDMVYGIDFYNQKFGIDAVESFVVPGSGVIPPTEEIDMSMLAVQVKVLGSLVLIHKHLSIELGPALQLNSKLRYDDRYENYIIDGYNTLQIKEIEEVSTLNFNVIAGATAGFEHFRVFARYQYGINNFLNPLNDKTLENNGEKFKGNISMLEAGLTIFF